MANESSDLKRPSKAQNFFAIAVVIFSVFALGIGGTYMRRSHRGSPPSGESGTHTSSSDSIKIGSLTAQIKGVFKTPSTDVMIEFKNSEGKVADAGQVKLSLDMNMPGMVMHDDGVVSGAAGRYRAKLHPQMVGDWNAKLSYSGPQGTSEKTFPITVK